VARPQVILAFLLPAAICAAWAVLAGKDVNWDLLNYHYYLGYELLGRRLAQDFFAASAQSYLNPIGYLPFYLMVSSGWHSVLASIALAALHGLSLTFLFLIARKLFAHLAPREQLVFSLLGTALGAATWVFWPTVGSSFLDPLLAPAILAALLLLVEGRRPGLAGALFGAAAALKYSNAIYLIAALPLAFTAGARLRGAAAYALGAGLALAALAGPWLFLLAREFGNPVFPLMNAWFESPHAPAVNLASGRFGPRELADALGFPFRMAALDRHLYSETFAPDLRLAALVAATLAIPLARRRPQQSALQDADWRVLGFLAAAWVLWLATSANARYGLPVLLLAGLALARLAERALPQRAARIALATLLAAQVAVCLVASPMRWFIAEPWSTRWLPYEAPERALREAALYLSVEILPMAVVAPFLHPASSFVNFAGQHSLPSDSPRLAALLERHGSRVRALGARLAQRDVATLKAYDDALRRLGYRVDATDCFTIAWRPEQDALARFMNKLSVATAASEPLSVGSCALVARPRDAADVEAERRISAIFARIEKRCGALLRGQTAVTEPFGSGWLRHYNGLDARLEAFGGGVLWHRHRSASVLDLGRVADWERDDAPLPEACR
jgi:hypothetical protein